MRAAACHGVTGEVQGALTRAAGRNSCCVESVSESEPVEAPTPCRQPPAMVGCVTAGGTPRWAQWGRIVKVGGGGYVRGETALPRSMGVSPVGAVCDYGM